MDDKKSPARMNSSGALWVGGSGDDPEARFDPSRGADIGHKRFSKDLESAIFINAQNVIYLAFSRHAVGGKELAFDSRRIDADGTFVSGGKELRLRGLDSHCFRVEKEKATLEVLKHFPPVLRRAGVSKMAFKSLVMIRSEVRGLGVENAVRCFSNGERRMALSTVSCKGNFPSQLGPNPFERFRQGTRWSRCRDVLTEHPHRTYNYDHIRNHPAGAPHDAQGSRADPRRETLRREPRVDGHL